ncbi:MAG: arginase family protein [Bacteroidia bacterium]|nr:arginase family protein [Bacteroidia bacterium]MCX7652537.1 arginase family protein [Bacteroidia bacterium]MDW8417520.1 arginase family protein [Bacteroidia bacterium]
MSLQVVGIACDWGAGQPGGASAIQSWYALGLYYKHLAWIEADHVLLSPVEKKPVWIETGRHVYARRLDAWMEFAGQVRETIRSLPGLEKVLFLTGDHSWAGCILPELHRRVGRIGVVWIDAHADLHNPATSPSGNLHGMPLAMVTGLNTERFHPVPAFTWNEWESLVQPVISAEDVVFIGLRSYEPPEMDIITRANMPHFTAADVVRVGITPAVEAIHMLVQRVEAIYVSFDVDVWDPSFARGTGSTAPGGLSIAHVRNLLNELFAIEKVRFLEVTEINPLLDRENQTALFAYGSIRPFIDGQLEDGRATLE